MLILKLSASSFDSPNMMICTTCCKEHSARAEWCADHLGLSWSHPLIVLDRLWAVPSNAHINTGHDLHVIVDSNLMNPVGPVQVLFPLPTSVALTGQIPSNLHIQQQSPSSSEHWQDWPQHSWRKEPLCATTLKVLVPSEGLPVTQDLNQGPAKLSRPVEAVHNSIYWPSPSTF